MDSGFPPTDARYRPPVFGYSHWTDAEGEVHLIYGPETPLPLPPTYQLVHTMSSAEADVIAAAAEADRRNRRYVPCGVSTTYLHASCMR